MKLIVFLLFVEVRNSYWFFIEGILVGYIDVKKLNIIDFKVFCYNIKISVLYMWDFIVSKVVFIF